MQLTKKMRAGVASALVIAAMSGGIILGVQDKTVSAAPLAGASAANPFVGPETIQDIVKQAGPAVVKIEAEIKAPKQNNPFFSNPFFREFFGDQYKEQTEWVKDLGSGIITSKDGYIVTNYHVVQGARKIDVYLTSRAEPYTAKLVGSDDQLDLALLKIDAGDELPLLKFGDSNKLEVGSWVIAIGNPYGLDHTVTVGVISAKGRPITINDNQFSDLLQTDASINPGNSGGPLINLQGEVIGINTAVNAEAQGIGFAIPSSTVTQVMDQLRDGKKSSKRWLGIYMQPVTKELAGYFGLQEPAGVLINSIAEDSPAQKAGLQRGDIVLEYNKKKVNSPEELKTAVTNSTVGEQVIMLVYRGGQTFFTTATISEK